MESTCFAAPVYIAAGGFQDNDKHNSTLAEQSIGFRELEPVVLLSAIKDKYLIQVNDS